MSEDRWDLIPIPVSLKLPTPPLVVPHQMHSAVDILQFN